ncbi:MAG: SIR2 family protein [Bacteroidota bacterium]
MAKKINALAKDLAHNQTIMSLLTKGNPEESQLEEILKDIISPKALPSRNIFVLGAGCSKSAYPDLLPLGDEASQMLENHFKKDTWPKSFLKKSKKIATKFNLPDLEIKKDFETRLLQLSYFLENSVLRQALSYMFEYRTFPNLFYETIAHLLKNRFIEAVINFNFDELLDQAIDEEVGLGQLHKILSDGDCIPYEKMLTNSKLKVPIYIKPHGTISHKSSLRFTKEQYIDIPDEIEVLMEELLSGLPDDEDVAITNQEHIAIQHHFGDLNLIVAGFNMESIEFNSLVKRAIEKRLNNSKHEVRIIFLNHDSSYKKKQKKRLKRLFKTKSKDPGRVKVEVINLDTFKSKKYGLDEYLLKRKLDCFGIELINRIHSHYKPEYKPKEIIRHLGLIVYFKEQIKLTGKISIFNLFKPGVIQFLNAKNELYFNSKQYFFDRTIFEVIIVILKNNGYIQPTESLKKDNRIGVYFNMYVETHRKKGFSKKVISKELSFYDILALLGLKSNINDSVKNFYKLDFADQKFTQMDFCGFMDNWIEKVKLVEKELPVFSGIGWNFKKYKNSCLESLKKFKLIFENLNSKKKHFAGDQLIRSDALNLYPNFLDIYLNFIAKIHSSNIVPTRLAFRYRFRSLFIKDNSWNRLCLVTDRGLFLVDLLREIEKRDDIKFSKPKTIYLIVSSNFAREEIERLSKKIKNLRILIYKVPYYDHNRHMILFDSNNVKYKRAIYFYKKGYSNNVNAVYLEGKTNKNNLNMMFQTFKKYLAKAIVFDKFDRKHLPYFEDQDQIDEIINMKKTGLKKKDKNYFVKSERISI